MWRDKPKAELVKENDRSVTTVAERRLVVHKRRAQPVASVHGCCLPVGGMSWSGPQMRSPRLRLLPIVERLACERARKEPRSHTVGEVVGARPDNATAVVFRACTSCRSVFLSVHNISVAYASSVRFPIVLYIPTPQWVLGRRVAITAARSTSVPHRRGGGPRRVVDWVVSVRCCTNDGRAGRYSPARSSSDVDETAVCAARWRPVPEPRLLLLPPTVCCSFACSSYLVDPASSHMLVSKIKPCMSKHKLLHSEAANGSLGHP